MDTNANFSARHHAITQKGREMPARFQVCKTHNKHGGAKPFL